MQTITGYRNETAKITQPEVIQLRPLPEAGQHSLNGIAAIDRIASGLSNINHVNKGGPVVISQNGLYGYTDLPPKEFGHVSGELMNL